MKKKLILMGGDLASGKSAYSRSVGKKLGITVINKDILKEILGDRFIAGSREENLKLSNAAFDIICYMIKSSQSHLIIESNFKAHEMKALSALVDGYDYDVLSLKFQGDDEVLHDRFITRLNKKRHYVHKSQDFSDIDVFSDALGALRAVKYIGRVIEIDSSNFDYTADEMLLAEIRRFVTE